MRVSCGKQLTGCSASGRRVSTPLLRAGREGGQVHPVRLFSRPVLELLLSSHLLGLV